MLKKPMLSLTAAMFLVCSAGLVQAQTTEAPTPDDQAKAQTTRLTVTGRMIGISIGDGWA